MIRQTEGDSGGNQGAVVTVTPDGQRGHYAIRRTVRCESASNSFPYGPDVFYDGTDFWDDVGAGECKAGGNAGMRWICSCRDGARNNIVASSL